MRRLINAVLTLALAASLAVLLFVVYEAYLTDIVADHKQDQIADDLRDDWALPVPGREQPDFGEGFAFLHIPELGPDWNRAVVEGTTDAALEAGPGHYVDSAMPGEIGNFSVAGHRVGDGAPFNALDELDVGDPILVETVDSWFTYRVTSNEIVSPEESAVIRPVPGGALSDQPTQAYLTLTTCHPEFSAAQRLIVHALLEQAVSKADEPRGPALLAAGG
jgi:sortase A